MSGREWALCQTSPRHLLRGSGTAVALLIASSVLWSGCVSSGRSPGLAQAEVEQIRQHAADAQVELSQTKNGEPVLDVEHQDHGQPHRTQEPLAPSAAQSPRLSKLLKRHAEVERELGQLEGQPYAASPKWVSFPVYQWLQTSSERICVNKKCAGDVGSYFFGCILVITCYPVYDLALLPFTFPYDITRSIGAHIGSASRAHRTKALETQLAKIEAMPEYTSYLDAQGKAEQAAARAKERMEEQRYGPGQIVWSTGTHDVPTTEIAATMSLGSSAWPNFENVASRLMRADFEKAVGEEPFPPTLLVQGKYESLDDFNQRVAQVGKGRNENVRGYNSRVKAYQLPSWRRNMILQQAFWVVFGSPKVAAVAYNPNTQIFSVEIVSDSPYANGFKQGFNLTRQVPNGKAPDFEMKLRTSSPEALFQRHGSHIKVVSGTFDIEGEKYQAVPVNDMAQQELARVDLGKLDTVIFPAPLKEVQVSFAPGGKNAIVSDVDQPQLPQQPEHPDDFALVVGVESYQDKNLPPAEFAERDADTVVRYLQTLGIPKDHLILLKGDDATHARISSRLNSWLPKNVQNGSRVFVYFSGHGSPDPVSRKTYLMPWDGEPKLLQDTALSTDAIYKSLGNLKSKQILVAMDSCFSGGGGRSVIQSGARPLVTVNSGIVPPNVTLISAARPDEIAQSKEDQGYGMMTYFLLKGLNEGKDNAHDLCEFLKPQVSRAAALENQEQHPVCQGPTFKFW